MSEESNFFMNRWITRLPGRWAGAGAVFGGIVALFGLLNDLSQLRPELPLLFFVLAWFIGWSGGCALIGYLIGLGVRHWLRSHHERTKHLLAASLPGNWASFSALVALLIFFALAFFTVDIQSPTRSRQPRGVENIFDLLGWAVAVLKIGYVDAILFTVVAGATAFIVGLISRRGLRQAIADDEMRAPAIKSASSGK